MSGSATIAGRRVLLTRSREDCALWAARLERHGAQAIVLPCIVTELLDTPERRRALAEQVSRADWLVLTSRRGADACAALLASTAIPQALKIAAVGAATGEAARALLGRVDHCGSGTAVDLASSLLEAGQVEPGATVVLAVAENAGDALARKLEAAGARCSRIDVYRTVPAPRREAKRPLSTLGADSVVLASPSAVTGFVHQVEIDRPTAIYTIGPSTTAAAREHGLAVSAEARVPSFDGVLEAMQCPS